MVWLPGEGFDFADARQFNGAYLASLGQVIVITIQYRVGVFGFFKENVALWDQLAALQWINQNAQSLGGNPENVTLFGRFTGSMSISILLSSPQIISSPKPLFSRAILMSGVAVGNWVFDKQQQHDDKVRQVFRAADCTNLDCLKAMPAEELLAKSGYGWKPIIDSVLIEEEPLIALRKGKFPKYIKSAMLGTNSPAGEGNLCLVKHMALDKPFYEKLINNNISQNEYQKAIREDLDMFYGNELPESSDTRNGGFVTDRSMYVEFCAELLINSHMRQYNELLHKISRNQSYGLENVFNYKLDYKPSFSIAPQFINSSIHGDDVILAFGLAFNNNMQTTASDLEISIMMVKIFSNFAQTGIPFESSHKYIEIKPSQKHTSSLCRLNNSEIMILASICLAIFFLVFVVKLAIQIHGNHKTLHSVKNLIQNHGELY